jgi:hypothetical protein
MRSTLLFAGLGCLACLLAGERPSRADPADELFLGKGLDLWESTQIKQWTYKDGVLTGTWSDPATSHPHLRALYSKKKFRDFELQFQVRSKNASDSVVGFRSGVERINRGLRLSGLYGSLDEPQLGGVGEFASTGQNWVDDSIWYSRRGLWKPPPFDELRKVVKPGAFNEVAIQCVGKHVTIKVNGLKTVDEDFAKALDEGVIVWGLSSTSASAELTFKNIHFRSLDKAR